MEDTRLPSEPGGEPPHEITTASHLVYDGMLLRVRRDIVRLPSGRERVREVVDHPGAVAVLALTTDGRVLLIRQYRHAAGRALLEIPAGIREPGEPAAETARRELIEETGFAPGTLTELATFFPTPGYSVERITLFRAEGCVPAGREDTSDEPATVVPVALAEVAGLLAPGPDQIGDGKTMIGLLWLLRETEGGDPRPSRGLRG